MTVKNIYDFLDSIAPYSDMCGWDNSGLYYGRSSAVRVVLRQLQSRSLSFSQSVLHSAVPS